MSYAMPLFFVAWMVKLVGEFANYKTLEKIGRTSMWLTFPVFILKIFEMLDELMSLY
jgi:drug/metabolite transporter superfamily protein YnfA